MFLKLQGATCIQYVHLSAVTPAKTPEQHFLGSNPGSEPRVPFGLRALAQESSVLCAFLPRGG